MNETNKSYSKVALEVKETYTRSRPTGRDVSYICSFIKIEGEDLKVGLLYLNLYLDL